MRKRYGVSLIEILVVVFIIALVASLLMPVFVSSRRKAHENHCISNLKQLASALLMYRQDHGDFPPRLLGVMPYVKSRELFICPADNVKYAGGANHMELLREERSRSVVLSYFYIGDRMVGRERLMEALPQADPNHGLVACLVHSECNRFPGCHNDPFAVPLCCDGLTLRVRIDGSVQRARSFVRPCIDPADNAGSEKRDYWYLFTDAPCPPDICTRNCY